MDNTGNYVTYIELFELMYPSTVVSYKSAITLSGKTGNQFTYAGNSFDLEIGDLLCQGEYVQEITALGASTLDLEDATNFSDGASRVYRVTKSLFEINMMLQHAMLTIDMITGQWFNKREFTGDNAVKYEGNNTYILHLPVPIIEVNALYLNNLDGVYNSEQYQVFNSRAIPDDRRNPRIKLFSKTHNVFVNAHSKYYDAVFYKGMMQRIEGSFGFLEQDGSTPAPIKWLTARMVMKQALTDPENLITAKIKKEKTDMHEIEFETTLSTGRNAVQGTLTGDDEMDRILQMYKSPISIGGPDPLYSTIIQFYDVDRVVW